LGAMLTNPAMKGAIPLVVNPIEALAYDFIGPLVKESTGQEPINISGRDLNRMIQQTPDLQRVDVRTPQEYAQGHVPGAINIPLQDVNAALESGKIDKNKPLVFICQSGARSYMGGASWPLPTAMRRSITLWAERWAAGLRPGSLWSSNS